MLCEPVVELEDPVTSPVSAILLEELQADAVALSPEHAEAVVALPFKSPISTGVPPLTDVASWTPV